jgi:hypothetical protein
MESNTSTSDALSKRVAHLRKAYAKGLGHKPSTLESAALLTAARLNAEAEFALADPSVSLNEKSLVKASGHDHPRTDRSLHRQGRDRTSAY